MCDLNGCADYSHLPALTVDPKQRRLFLQGMATLPLAAVLAYPELTHAAASSVQDVSLTVGDKEVSAALALPEAEKAPAVLLIHEWWGLNDQIKAVAKELANMGYIALAVDLYGGENAKDPAGAMALMKAVDKEHATNTLTGWIDMLKNHERSNGKVATMGWCFGGGWSLNASVATPVDATIVYYGRVTTPADQLKALNGPVLGHFGKLDKNINEAMVSGFEKEMATAGKSDSLTVHWYDANHAFANPTGSRYDEKNAALAWERTTQFLKAHLGS
ncbi:MAG: dienelactone hydrolase family protein [Thiolinea sp.]